MTNTKVRKGRYLELITKLNDKEQARIQGKIKELLQKETRMNLYLLTQNVCNGYDTYDSCVVAAETPEDAALIRPDSTEWGQYIQ